MRFAARFVVLLLAGALPALAIPTQAIPASAAPAPKPDDGDWTLATLMAELQHVKSAAARFTEHKYIHMLTRPLDSSGTLAYAAPNRLEMITLTPSRESILLQDDELSGTRSDGHRYSISLSDHPDIAALVEGVRSTLAGDLPTLERYYQVTSNGTRAGWQLMLMPKDKDVRAKVDLIRILGAGASLREIDVLEADGDHSEMSVLPEGP